MSSENFVKGKVCGNPKREGEREDGRGRSYGGGHMFCLKTGCKMIICKKIDGYGFGKGLRDIIVQTLLCLPKNTF